MSNDMDSEGFSAFLCMYSFIKSSLLMLPLLWSDSYDEDYDLTGFVIATITDCIGYIFLLLATEDFMTKLRQNNTNHDHIETVACVLFGCATFTVCIWLSYVVFGSIGFHNNDIQLWSIAYSLIWIMFIIHLILLSTSISTTKWRYPPLITVIIITLIGSSVSTAINMNKNHWFNSSEPFDILAFILLLLSTLSLLILIFTTQWVQTNILYMISA
eukprot:78258_1